MSINKFASILLILFLFSCSSEKPKDLAEQKTQMSSVEQATSKTLEIAPINATKKMPVYLIPHGFKISDAKIEWLVNGVIVEAQRTEQFNTSEYKKGDNIQAKAIIDDKEIFSNTIQLRNSPPELKKVKLLPDNIHPGDTLSVEVEGYDPDGDEITYEYEWKINGEPAGNNSTIEGRVKRGDKITLTITPSDGEEKGRAVFIQREIGNMPPKISDNKKFNFDGKIFTFQVNATDPDGDALTYSLKSSPKGMTINSSSGLIRWDVPSDFKGRASFTVSVSDGHGGETLQSFNLNIR
jgi:translation initiation factor IF-1